MSTEEAPLLVLLTLAQQVELAACLATVTPGSTLLDDEAGDPWIYYDISLRPDEAGTLPSTDIRVFADGKCVGTLLEVSEQIRSGQLRVATAADDVQPQAVMQRFGLSRRAHVLHVSLPTGDVWIGTGAKPSYPAVFDANGGWVRSVTARQTAFEAYEEFKRGSNE